jgi:hypothetical protein
MPARALPLADFVLGAWAPLSHQGLLAHIAPMLADVPSPVHEASDGSPLAHAEADREDNRRRLIPNLIDLGALTGAEMPSSWRST